MSVLADKAVTVLDDLLVHVEGCDVVLPSCRYVSHCAPVLDCCDVMALYVDQVVADTANGCNIFSEVTWVVELWFCVTAAEVGVDGFVVPDPVVTQAEALGMLDAAWAVYHGLVSVLTGDCDSVEAARLECLEAQGGCAGFKISVTSK